MTTIAMPSAGRAETIDEVLERMALIESSLPPSEGVATFNRMYTHVTRLVRDAVDADQFLSGDFLERLDVHFANLFFDAHAADAVGAPVAPAWTPLFEARRKPAASSHAWTRCAAASTTASPCSASMWLAPPPGRARR